MNQNSATHAIFLFSAGVFLSFSCPLCAEVRLPAVFSDHMVLQQQELVPVWGTATPGAKVSVTFAGQSHKAVADGEGKWKVELAPMEASFEGRDLSVKESNEVILKDVLVGEVWICSGQSNMEWGISAAYGGKEAVAQANIPGIRLLTVERSASLDPNIDLKGKWLVCTPETAKQGMLQGFSAVGFWFAKEIHDKRKAPVGMIHAARGGSSILPWTPLSALEKEPRLQPKAAEIQKLIGQLPSKREIYQTQLEEWEKLHGEWKSRKDAWQKAAVEAKRAGQPEPDKSSLGKEPVKPDSPEGGKIPSALFNAMIRPIIPYAMRGVIWYQGESNATNENLARAYSFQFKTLITGWREAWGKEDISFLYVQLPFFKLGGSWPTLRESQALALELPHTGMAVALDLNQDEDLHPRDKADVALRLFLCAQRVAYGETVDDSGPVLENYKIEGNKVVAYFKEASGKLCIGAPPATAFADGKAPTPSETLLGFELAGEDKVFHPAKGTIEGLSVVLVSENVPNPKHLRYAWAPVMSANLYDGNGLPAPPFQK